MMVVVVVRQSRTSGVRRFVPQDGVQRLRRGRKRRWVRVGPVVQGNVHGPDDPEYRARVPPLDLGRALLIMSHGRDAVPQRAEPVPQLRQRPRDVEMAHDAEGVSDQAVQVEVECEGGVVRRREAFDDVDEVREEHAVAVREVSVQDVLWDVQLAHDDVLEPALVAVLHARGDGGGHALRRDGDVWIVVVAVRFREEPEVEGPKYMHGGVVIRVPAMECLIEGDREERGQQIQGSHVYALPPCLDGLGDQSG